MPHHSTRTRRTRSTLLSTIVLILFAIIAPAIAHATAASSPSADAASANSAAASDADLASARPARTLDYDPDEIEGVPEDESNAELLSDDDEDASTRAPPTPQSIWDDPETLGGKLPAAAIDPERQANSLDWLHVHVDVRLVDEQGEAGRMLFTTRRLGREPWLLELGSAASADPLRSALHGARIGEKREVKVEWSDELQSSGPPMADEVKQQLEPGDELLYTLRITRFDLDVKELTLQDRSVESHTTEFTRAVHLFSLSPSLGCSAALLRVSASGIRFRC